MPTRRDQLQSYQFLMQRVVSAFAYHDTDPVQPAGRRLVGAGLGGLMVAVVLVAGVGVYALLRPGGSDAWRDGGSIIVESETGTRYVYRDEVLYPMDNFASAALVLGTTDTRRVSRNSLAGVPRGPRAGIPGAPDALPPGDQVLTGPWSVCNQRVPEEEQVSTTLHVGRLPAGGTELGEDALLAQVPGTDRAYLVWGQHRYEIADRRVGFTALGLDRHPPTLVDEAWLSALPAGRRLAADPPDGRGAESTAVSGARVGQVYVVDGGAGDRDRQHYLVADRRRLAPVTEVEANLLLAAPETGEAYPDGEPVARPLTASAAASADKLAPRPATADSPPPRVPAIVAQTSPEAAVCVELADPASPPRLVRDVPHPPAPPVTAGTADGGALVDRVEVAPGRVAVVVAVPSPEAPLGTVYLVTDQGIRHALAGEEVLPALGYGEVAPVRVPAELVARIPAGPPLDPIAALQPVRG